jgi:3-isopropylmalate/(R)-2-methylmalate dehydratase large subunit
MEKQFSGKLWKMPDDVDTDNIIPGRRGTIPTIEEMKKYAFEHLKPEFGKMVKEGDIIVAGKNFGCGSSREQAASVIVQNGVHCIIAKSFARIFFRNAFNSGILLIECDGIQDVCEEGDTVTIEVNKCVSANGQSFPIKPVPENLFKIVVNGGLIEDTKKRISDDDKLHIRQSGFTGNIKRIAHYGLTKAEMTKKKGYTLAEKLLMKNSGVNHVVPGDIVITRPDMFMVHDIYTPYLVDTFNKIGAAKIDDPEKVTIIFDHCMPTAVAKNDSAHYDAGLELAKRFGIRKLHIGEGICHFLMHEKRYGRPGEVATATDSHTTTYGGAGCFCTGIGTAEMAAALITGELWFKVPEAIKIVLNGKMPAGVYPKDIILKILGDIKSDGGQYKSLEFSGPAAKDMSMAARFTIANMSLEAGAKCALFDADEKTAEYYGLPFDEIVWVHADEDAHYSQVLTYDVSEISPQLSCPQGVDNVHPIDEILGTPIDEVYIGTCTNGSLEDLSVAAAVLEGKKVSRNIRFVVMPATNLVYKEAIRLGYIQTFVESGAVICHPGCGLCAGFPYGLMADDEKILITANRNFIGRMGTKKSLIYLSSPAVAAVSALTGVISDPRLISAN